MKLLPTCHHEAKHIKCIARRNKRTSAAGWRGCTALLDLYSWYTPDNYGLNPARKPLFCYNFCPCADVWLQCIKTQHLTRADVTLYPAATLQVWFSGLENKTKKNISAIGITKRWKTVNRIKLKTGTCVLQEKHCPQEARCDSCRSSAEGRGVRSKILEWRRGLSLSQSAPLGRLDCNESSQSKRDLLATAGEPALATLSGSRLQ